MNRSYYSDTIAALSTPPGNGGISIIRISGPDSVRIADSIFTVKRNILPEDQTTRASDTVARMLTHTIKHGYIIDTKEENPEIIDECLISLMKAPKSYTCEDVVEINIHGGFSVVNRTLGLIFKNGARPAQPGEFTKRAFLNGRMNLSEAEAVMDIINSKTEESRKAAVDQLTGKLADKISEIKEMLVLCLAEIEVSIDYPEYEMDDITGKKSMDTMLKAEEQLSQLSKTYSRGRIIKEGLKIVIAGKPNAGKSSLMNRMAGSERAIVTDIPGTTRDIVEETIDFEGIPLVISDTAGLRATKDAVEKIGVERAFSEIEKADMILYMIDGKDTTENINESIDLYKERFNPDKTIVLINKTDCKDYKKEHILEINDMEALEISVLNNEGIEDIFLKIREFIQEKGVSMNSQTIITNQRHKYLVDKALQSLQNAKESYINDMPLDCISFDLWESGNILGEIIGQSVSEDVVNTIFSKFCLGK